MSLATPVSQISRGRLRLLVAAVAVPVLVILGIWYAHHPSDLPTSENTKRASTPIGQPVYVGVVTAGSDFSRTLSLSGVKVHTTSNTSVSVDPLLCRGGAIGVTTDPSAFCSDLVNPEGQDFGANDTIVLQVVSDEPAIAVIDRVRLGFREGLQWGTEPAGSPAIVSVVAR